MRRGLAVALARIAAVVVGLLAVALVARSGQGDLAVVCRAEAVAMHATQDYTGSPAQRECFGHEDDPRVDVALVSGTWG